MGRRRKQSDIEKFGEMLDPSDTLAVLLRAVPSRIEKLLSELEKPEGMGRKILRQVADQYLSLLDSMATARDEGRLDDRQMADYVALMQRFLPVLEPLKRLHGRIPQQVEQDAQRYGPQGGSSS